MESVSVIKEVPKEIPQEVPQTNISLFKRNPELFKHITIICGEYFAFFNEYSSSFWYCRWLIIAILFFFSDNPIRYKCTVCNKSFKSKANCSYHKNCPNDSMKQHECEICKRRFSVKSHFKYHLLTHNGKFNWMKLLPRSSSYFLSRMLTFLLSQAQILSVAQYVASLSKQKINYADMKKYMLVRLQGSLRNQ